mmetsp:Transcript_21023/g.51670  ORF Transcript_21023/g.51670 Transcript_21023/m.51670 type:complete len:241 (-) Transcript_21023:2638-3360(-)
MASKQCKDDPRKVKITELVKMYGEGQKEKARELVKICLTEVAKEKLKNGKELNELIDETLQGLIDIGPRLHLLLLYMRWAKKTPQHCQTDSMSVLHTITEQFKAYNHDYVSLMNTMTLRYKPGTLKRKGGKFGCSLSMSKRTDGKAAHGTTKPIKKKGRKRKRGPKSNGSSEFQTSELADRISKLESLVHNVAFGKTGMRSGLGPTKSNRVFQNDDSVFSYVSMNMLEFHKPAEFFVCTS